jgi:hypothetical protein
MPTPIERLGQIAGEMEHLAAPGRPDIEADHGRADDLLFEAFKWATRDRLLRESADRITAAYEDVPKWYA